MMIMTTNMMPCTEKRSIELHSVPRRVLCLSDSATIETNIDFVGVLSVAGEEVAGVDAGGDVGEVGGGAVGQDGAAQALELGQVVDHA